MAFRNLAPKSEFQYTRILARAFEDPIQLNGFHADAVQTWPASSRELLRAALKRRGDTTFRALIEARGYTIKRQTRSPGESDLTAYETACAALPRGLHALALLPLKLGLRANELCSIPRAEIERAIESGDLIVLRKGGSEKVLPAKHVQPLLYELLEAPSKAGPKWTILGELLSTGVYISQYHALHKLIVRTGKKAKIKVRPHLLRHAFATRMSRDGANVFTIQAALGHASVQTTQRYVHPSTADIAKFVR